MDRVQSPVTWENRISKPIHELPMYPDDGHEDRVYPYATASALPMDYLLGMCVCAVCWCAMALFLSLNSVPLFSHVIAIISNWKMKASLGAFLFHVVQRIGLWYIACHHTSCRWVWYMCGVCCASRYVIQIRNQSKRDFHKKHFSYFLHSLLLFAPLFHHFVIVHRCLAVCVPYRFTCNTRAGVSK